LLAGETGIKQAITQEKMPHFIATAEGQQTSQSTIRAGGDCLRGLGLAPWGLLTGDQRPIRTDNRTIFHSE
jgi:hypothetical protein